MPKMALPVLTSPIIRRVAWHVRRVAGQVDRRFFISLGEGIIAIVAIAAILITLLEKPPTIESFFDSFNWGIATVLGQGNADFVTSPGGRVVGWLLILFGVAMLGMITGALVAMVIDFLLKEGQGLGASGHRDHIVVCGWNSTARDLIDELRGDDYKQKVVVLADRRQEPGGRGHLFRARRCDRHRRPRAGGDDRGVGGARLPGRWLGRGGHALDPGDHGHQVDRAGRPDGVRGQQPAPRTAFPPRRGGRAAGDVQGRFAPARALGPVPGADRRS